MTILKVRPVDLTEVEPSSIRHASHRGTVGDLRVIVREHEATAGGVDLMVSEGRRRPLSEIALASTVPNATG
jgi:hypothetical protein